VVGGSGVDVGTVGGIVVAVGRGVVISVVVGTGDERIGVSSGVKEAGVIGGSVGDTVAAAKLQRCSVIR
jgi:hypothetical protein